MYLCRTIRRHISETAGSALLSKGERLNSVSTSDQSFRNIFLSWHFPLTGLNSKLYEIIILRGYDPWCLTSREDHSLRMFNHRAPRRIFGPKRDVVTGGWKTQCVMRSFTVFSTIIVFLDISIALLLFKTTHNIYCVSGHIHRPAFI
jgi:hypothetical protein